MRMPCDDVYFGVEVRPHCSEARQLMPNIRSKTLQGRDQVERSVDQGYGRVEFIER